MTGTRILPNENTMRPPHPLPRIRDIRISRRVLFLVLTLTGLFASGPVVADTPQTDSTHTEDRSPNPILIGTIQGAIGPVTKDYVHRVLEHATHIDAGCVIFTMDTPGGLDASMRSIIKDIFASPVPVVIFVYPSGGRAASAGALITLASHVSAMAPGTNIGAAHPVPIGQGDIEDDMREKVTNDAAAYARGIAKERGRDVEWAEKIVRESISSTAEEAESLGVTDIVAQDMEELIKRLDGRIVVIDGEDLVLTTARATRVEMAPSLRERFLALISDPNIAYLLMLLGIFGIFFELQNPGAIFPGVVGAIAILLAFFALQLLPVNLAGLALIILAIVMFLLEIKIPSGGLLTIGGVVSMLIGSIMFIDSPLPFMRVSISVIIPAVIFTALFFVFAVGMGLRAQRRKVTTGGKGIVGETGVAKSDIAEDGSAFVHGEHWNAVSDEPIPANSKIEVVGIEGMVLKVKRIDQKEV
ncbi:MAG: nodulation protein NfeD [Candidatus Latescibacterota bacterium]|nr:MAG: nodulation protein NfeD [Candidatus Latescibacterota bacterium]